MPHRLLDLVVPPISVSPGMTRDRQMPLECGRKIVRVLTTVSRLGLPQADRQDELSDIDSVLGLWVPWRAFEYIILPNTCTPV